MLIITCCLLDFHDAFESADDVFERVGHVDALLLGEVLVDVPLLHAREQFFELHEELLREVALEEAVVLGALDESQNLGELGHEELDDRLGQRLDFEERVEVLGLVVELHQRLELLLHRARSALEFRVGEVQVVQFVCLVSRHYHEEVVDVEGRHLRFEVVNLRHQPFDLLAVFVVADSVLDVCDFHEVQQFQVHEQVPLGVG